MENSPLQCFGTGCSENLPFEQTASQDRAVSWDGDHHTAGCMLLVHTFMQLLFHGPNGGFA